MRKRPGRTAGSGAGKADAGDGLSEKQKQKKASPFDVVNSLRAKREFDFDPKTYNPWMVNRIVAMGDPVEAVTANFVNCLPGIPKRNQYLFYWHTLRQGRKRMKYVKAVTSDTALLRAVAKIYGVDLSRAEETAELLSDEQKNAVKLAAEVSG